MSRNESEFPFEELFVAVVGTSKRAYTSQGPARARITNDVSRRNDLFENDCELWKVNNDGWRLILRVTAGDHSDQIPWNKISETRKKTAELEEQRRKAYKDARDREEYERLKEKFGN